MNNKDTEEIFFEGPLNYSLQNENNIIILSGEARARLDNHYLSIIPEIGEPLLFSFIDILGILEEDYKIKLFLSPKEKLTLFYLGYQYEDFLKILHRLRNELFLRYLLMAETLRESGIEAEFIYSDDKGEELHRGNCELHLYETALLVLPQKGEPLRYPYSDIHSTREEDYRFMVETDTGERLIVSQMGEKFDFFKRSLSKAMGELSYKVQSMVKELLPMADPIKTRKLAFLLREGRAVKKSDIEAVSKEFWGALETKVEAYGSKEEYDFLKGMSQEEQISIGLKRGLMGDLTGEYLWFLIPIFGTNTGKPGNAVAMEAISEEEEGRATYFFRMSSRKEYPEYNNLEDLHQEFNAFIKNINRCMIEINFRREPIYLSEERLGDPRYEKYRFALNRIASLRNLRSLFIGRVIHSSPEQWKSGVMDLLRFNVSTTDDSAKWTGEAV